MYGIILGIVFGLFINAWFLLLIIAIVHGTVMSFRISIRKPTDIEKAVDRRMEMAGTKKFSERQIPILEFITEGLLFLAAGSITYGLRIVL